MSSMSLVFTPGGGGSSSLTSVDYTLSGDVTMTNADQFYDGPSGSFAAGTWLITWKILYRQNAGQSQAIAAKLWDGTTTYDEINNDYTDAGAGAVSQLDGSAIVTLGSTTTLKVSVISARASGTIKRDTTYQSATSHTATRLCGVKIA